MCCDKTPNFDEIDKGCTLRIGRPPDRDQHRRTFVRLAVVPLGDKVAPIMHHDCQHNQVAAVLGRVIKKTPKPTRESLVRLRKVAIALARRLPRHTQASLDSVLSRFTGMKLARYSRARDDLAEQEFSARMSHCKGFVKGGEKTCPATKTNPDPRMIQYRDPRYTLVLFSFLKRLEHDIYSFRGGSGYFPPGLLIGKCLSAASRGMELRRKWCELRNPVCFILDISRFDLHVDAELLKIEHLVYITAVGDPRLARLLGMQLRNNVKTSAGLIYRVHGRRMSGDGNTAVGNCLLMTIMVLTAVNLLGISPGEIRLLDDGDDACLMMEKDHAARFEEEIGPIFLDFGMKLKVDMTTDEFEKIDWCQTRPINVRGDEWVCIRNPAKVTTGALTSIKFKEPTARPKLVYTVGLCEAILNKGIPVLQSYAHALMRNAGTTTVLNLDSTDPLFHRIKRDVKHFSASSGHAVPIEECARHSFFLAFGITPEEQVTMERGFDGWTFPTTGDTLQAAVPAAYWADLLMQGSEVYHPWECPSQ
jgi:hypothetical protein